MKQALAIITLAFLICSCNSSQPENQIAFTKEEIKLDGKPNETAWKNASWKAIDQKWLGGDYTKEDFNGKYKVVWDSEHLYVLAEITDDVLFDEHSDGLVNYWDDDCLEIFIDEDASGGNHQYNYNAFAYHIALDDKIVDIGTDSLPHYYDHVKSVRKTIGNTSIWEVSIDIYDDNYSHNKPNQKVVLEHLKEIGFAIAYCDNDASKERENFIGSALVEGKDKNRGWIDAGIFEKFTLQK